MKIGQVVPGSDPLLGGVSGYAEALAGGLSRMDGIASDLIAVGGSLAGRMAGTTTCLFHYVNYAYHPRGCPKKLVRELLRWRRERPERRLITFFHEVYASGPFWRSSFWLAPVQRRLAAALARASDRSATSLALYARMLARFHPPGEPVVSPVFSTVGEPAAVPGLTERPPVMVVFGGPGVRGRSYGGEREALTAACRALGIEEIVDLGPPLSSTPRIDGIPVRILGALPAIEVSARMLAARAGFLAYPPDFLPKSTIFAAYCAHGLLPVCAGSRERERTGRELPFWRPGPDSPPAPDLQALANAARAWYLPHSLARQAEAFRDLFLAAGAVP